MDAQTSAMFLQLMAQNQQLMTQLMSQNANNNATLNGTKKTHKTLADMTPINITDFLDDFDFISLNDLHATTLPEFYANNIFNNLNKYEAKDSPLQLIDKKRKKISYYHEGQWLPDDKWFTIIYNKIFKYYCSKLSEIKKKTKYGYIHEADEFCDEKDIDEIQTLIGKFFDVTKYPFSILKEKTITRLATKMTVEIDE